MYSGGETILVESQAIQAERTSSSDLLNKFFEEEFRQSTATTITTTKTTTSSQNLGAVNDKEVRAENRSSDTRWLAAGEKDFLSPSTKIHDLIESPIINRSIILSNDQDRLANLPAKRLSFAPDSPEHPVLATKGKMTKEDTNTRASFAISPDVPKFLPKSTRAAIMLERAAAANAMISSATGSPQPSPRTTSRYRSRASLPAKLAAGENAVVNNSPKRALKRASSSSFSRAQALVNAVKKSNTADSIGASSDAHNSDPSVEENRASIANVVGESSTATAVCLEDITPKKKSILKQVNHNDFQSPRTASGRKINFREPIVTKRLYDKFAAAMTVSQIKETGDDVEQGDVNENVIETPVKHSASKKRKINDFTVLSAEDNNKVEQDNDDDDEDDADDDIQPPKRKIARNLFEDATDWEITPANEEPPPEHVENAKVHTKIADFVEEPIDGEDASVSKIETETNITTQNSKSTMESEVTPKEAESNTNQPPTLELSSNAKPSTSNAGHRSSFLASSRAMAMMSKVIGDRATQIFAEKSTLSTSPIQQPVKKEVSAVKSNAPSPLSLSRSYALVQASMKIQENRVKSIHESVSCPNLFETPEKNNLNIRSCLKSPLDSERKKARRLSFADNIVSDELFYRIDEPSSCVGRDLNLRKQSSSSSSEGSIDTTESEAEPSSAKRRLLCHQASIIAHESKDDEDEDGESNDSESPAAENSSDEANQFDFDEKSFIHDMKSVAQDLTGHDASNLGEITDIDDSTDKIDTETAETSSCSSSFTEDDLLAPLENGDFFPIQDDEESEENNPADVSDSMFQDANSSIDSNETTPEEEKSSTDQVQSSSLPSTSFIPTIDIVDDSTNIPMTSSSTTSTNTTDENDDPMVNIQVPLSLARQFFQMFKSALDAHELKQRR